MPKLCPNIRFLHQQDFFPIRSVTKSSTDENLVEKFKIFVQDFVPIRTALRQDFRTKILSKNLRFLDKILGPAKIFQWLKFVLDEGFVQFGPRMFRQTSGVFMGTSPAPELANNFGFWHEFEFLSHMVNEYQV